MKASIVEDPFDPELPQVFDAIVAMLEKCWGLALLHFLTGKEREALSDLQYRVAHLCCPDAADSLREARHFIEFHESEQFHLTFMVLSPNMAGGPVMASELVKSGHNINELTEIITAEIAKAKPVTVSLNQFFIGRNKVIFGLLGSCFDAESAEAKCNLVHNLNKSLQESFNISPRPYEIDPQKIDKVHSAFGIIKRSPPIGYLEFVRKLKELEFEPITFTITDISLVHTKRAWTVSFPQQGVVRFPFGIRDTRSNDELVMQLHFE